MTDKPFNLGRFIRDYKAGRLATLDREVQRLRHMMNDDVLTPEMWVDLDKAISLLRSDKEQPVMDQLIYLLADIGMLWLELNDLKDFQEETP